MTVVSLVLFVLWQLFIPMAIGSMFYKVHKGKIFQWICGQMLLWAGFQIFTVLFIIAGKNFVYVMWSTLIYTFLLLLCAAAVTFRKGRMPVRQLPPKLQKEMNKRIIVLYAVSGVLLLFQLIMTVCYAYEEGDDAFYLALSTNTANDNSMYFKNAYTGYTTGLDIRHGLAPFPMWIAFLSRVTGTVPITMAQIVLPVGLILMAYGIHYFMGQHLFEHNKEHSLLYFVLVEVLVLFGGYSLYSVENFLLVRISQGKAVLCNLILPFMFFLYLIWLKRKQKQKEVDKSYWVLLGATVLAGCLCSTQGGLIVCVSMALFGMCTAIWYKQWKHLIPLGVCCCFPVGFMLMYLIMG